jgi:glucose-1-phosphate cytidylyltransferase
MGGKDITKPLVEVGGMPILWHIMKIYKYHGISNFILCLSHNGAAIKRFFLELDWLKSDFQYAGGEFRFFQQPEDWRIDFVDTMTGGRIKRIQPFVGQEDFMLTYGDGVFDVDLGALLSFHNRHNRIATVTGIQRRSGYGFMDAQERIVTSFREKPLLDGLVNGGFFILRPQVFAYLEGDQSVWEEGTGSWRSFSTRASGMRWIPSRMSKSSMNCGSRAGTPG